MIKGTHIGLPGFSLKRDVPLWGLSALVAVAAHAAVGLGVVALTPEKDGAGPQIVPLQLELAPLVVSEAESVETVETVAALEPEETVKEEAPTAEEEVVETVEEEQPEEVAELEPEIVEEAAPVAVKKAEVVLPKPVRKKVKKKPVKKVETRVEPVEKPVRKADVGKHNPDAKASSNINSQASRGAPAPSADAFARWRSRVNATVARRKPRGIGVSGRVTIVFVVNQSGSVVSSTVARSSGHPKLDSAALSMARGGVPAPPKGSSPSVSVTLPVDFQ